MVRQLALIVVTAAAVVWGAALLAVPLARDGASPGAADAVGEVSGTREPGLPARMAALTYVIGALVCHQRPERSFHLAGAPLPVCARCAALYWGGAAGLLAWLLSRRRLAAGPSDTHAIRGRARAAAFRRALIVAAVPVVITVATAAAGIWDPPNLWRAWLSAPLGLVVGALVAAVAAKDLR